MNGLAGQVKAQLGKRHLTQFVSLGQGDLSDADAGLIAAAKNFDAIGINCYREDPNAFEQLIALAQARLKVPIYFSEIGLPARDHAGEQKQSDYLWHVCSIIYSHGAGRVRSGIVIGAFVHEATDEAWKRFERGKDDDAHYGVLGKMAEANLRQFFMRNRDFSALVLPADDAPDTLINAAWQCLYGPYTRQQPRDYGYAMAYANRAITLSLGEAQKQQAELQSFKSPPEVAANPKFWALNSVGTGYFIIGDAWMLLSFDFRGGERAPNLWQRTLQLADYRESKPIIPRTGEIVPTNADNCVYYARQVLTQLRTQYSYAQLREANGTYRPFQKAISARFPEMLPPYIPLTWKNCAIFTGSLFVVILGFALISGHRAAKVSGQIRSRRPGPGRAIFIRPGPGLQLGEPVLVCELVVQPGAHRILHRAPRLVLVAHHDWGDRRRLLFLRLASALEHAPPVADAGVARKTRGHRDDARRQRTGRGARRHVAENGGRHVPARLLSARRGK